MKNSAQSLTILSQPSVALSGSIEVPGDKSISHRAVILGAIASGQTKVYGFLKAADTLATVKAFQQMGIELYFDEADVLVIEGQGMHGLKETTSIDCGNSGTTMRLLAGLLSAQNFNSVLTGDASLLMRPMGRIQKPLALMQAKLELSAGDLPPIRIQGNPKLHGIHYTLPIASAQLKSALLLAGLYASGETLIEEPSATRDHTERLLGDFGVKCIKKDRFIQINGKQSLQAQLIHVPGDFSSAAFFIVAATLIPGSAILIRNLSMNPYRMGLCDILNLMGARLVWENPRWMGSEPIADLRVEYAPLKGVLIPENLVPLAIDEFPIIMVAAARATGKTVLRGASELRFKESDRINSMVNGLSALQVSATALDDGVEIEGGLIRGGTVDAVFDHRIAMAFAIAGACAEEAVCILNADGMVTSFPSFVDIAKEINLSVALQMGHFGLSA